MKSRENNTKVEVEETLILESENTKVPKWLRRLEKESWQAELLISGLALYGTLHLPKFVFGVADFLIDVLPVDYYLAGYTISFLYLFGISILTTFFIIHFVLRAYWIGLIGLNSIYPNGYKIEGGYYSEIYSRLVAKMLPTVRESIKEIDKLCSGLFSGAFVFLIMYGMMSITFGILLLIYMATNEYIPKFVWIILVSIYFIVNVLVMVYGVMGKSPKFRNNEKLQTNFFKIAKVYGKINTPFFYKPLNQIMFTTQSNTEKMSSNLKVGLPFIIISMLLSLFYMLQSNITIMIDKGIGDQINIHDNTVYSNNYLDQYHLDQNIFVPVIDSDIISGPFIKLFIPTLRNEKYIREAICGEYEKDESLGRDENSILKRKFRIECTNRYVQVYINGTPYNAEFLIHDHIQEGRRGVQCYIPSSVVNPGKNKLKVEKYKNADKEIYDSYIINFWYAE